MCKIFYETTAGTQFSLRHHFGENCIVTFFKITCMIPWKWNICAETCWDRTDDVTFWLTVHSLQLTIVMLTMHSAEHCEIQKCCLYELLAVSIHAKLVPTDVSGKPLHSRKCLWSTMLHRLTHFPWKRVFFIHLSKWRLCVYSSQTSNLIRCLT
jgi:hypothetical protein